MVSKKLIFILINIIFLFTMFSCNKQSTNNDLEREDKFTLSIGSMDNELDFFARDSIPFSLETDIFMDNGIFFISNGNGKKIMKFNSYGDLLQKISPIPQNGANRSNSNWTLFKPGQLSKNSSNIFLVDTLDYDVALSDNFIDKSKDLTEDKSEIEKHILNEQIISVFDNEGNYVNYLGQDGFEGTPFPFINNIYSDEYNNLIVITQTTYFWTIYKFNPEGRLLGSYDIQLDYLPQLENNESTITQINNIIPDRTKNRVLIELTFYKETFDEKTGATITMDYVKSRVYYYSLDEDKYISWMDTPTSDNEEERNNDLYVLEDIVNGKYLFFMHQSNDGETQYLTITNENGYIIGEYDLQIDNSNIIYKSFYVTNSGMLTALLCTDYAAGVVMWRTDKILEEDSTTNG